MAVGAWHFVCLSLRNDLTLQYHGYIPTTSKTLRTSHVILLQREYNTVMLRL